MFSHQVTTDDFHQGFDGYANQGLAGPIAEAMTQLRWRPFGNPALETHRVTNARGAKGLPVLTSKVSDGRRIIWTHDADTQVLLLVGEHDKMYRRAERMRIDRPDGGSIAVTMSRQHDDDPPERVHTDEGYSTGALFTFLTDQEMLDAGLSRFSLHLLRTYEAPVEMDGAVDELAWPQFEIAWGLLEQFEATGGHPKPPFPYEQSPLRHEAQDETSIVVRIDHLPRLPDVDADELTRWLMKPIEDWMVFLDPAQQVLVDRPFAGPSRISGPAGTGKTVVGLHRTAATLRKNAQARVLVTSLVRTLPPVLKSLHGRFAPDVADRAEFVGLHGWALQFLHASDLHPRFEPEMAQRELWAAIRTAGRPLTQSGMAESYLADEITWVIQGRGLGGLEHYLGLARTGRGSPLSASQRQQVWTVVEDYRTRLRVAGILDENDLLADALALVDAQGLSVRYEAVIVDEAQDLTLVGAKLAAGIARQSQGQLIVLGDGHQSIYPGAFRLSDAGIDIRGRSRVLTRNYRNAMGVLDAAYRLDVQSSAQDPTEERDAERPHDAARLVDGVVTLEGFETEVDLQLGLTGEIDRLRQEGVAVGDIAVLVPTNQLADTWIDRVAELDLKAMRLDSYQGIPVDAVKVGTVHRAKGLEFKHVLLPAVGADTLGDVQDPSEDDLAHAERRALARRQLFVAMTRARDSLWMGYTGPRSTLLAAIEGRS